ncbi:MAG: 30S ribosomal protein S2 [bacterium]
MAVVSIKQLLEAGVHFGHQTKRWNPKMKPYIFAERNGIHIIDLQKTVACIEAAYEVVRDISSNGGKVLFVGTKKQAYEVIQAEATRCGMPYVNQRWLGGLLTNFQTIKTGIKKLKDLRDAKEKGLWDSFTKRERKHLETELNRLEKYLGGIESMEDLPSLLFVVDIKKEENAVREAKRVGIPTVGIVDTNSDPEQVEYPIPGNDDAIRAIKLYCSKIADAVLEGIGARKEETEEEISEMPPIEELPPDIIEEKEQDEFKEDVIF